MNKAPYRVQVNQANVLFTVAEGTITMERPPTDKAYQLWFVVDSNIKRIEIKGELKK